jgi:H+/Cl- antiporter ClcA
VKLAAMVVAGAGGFRGGRIFPAVFVGVALGLCASSLIHSIPPALGVSCGILGFVLATSRMGWLSLLMAATVVGDATTLPLLCVAILPAWLLATGRPEMLITPRKTSPKEQPA